MFRYLIKRLLSGLFAFFIFTAVIFFSFNLLIPFDFVTTLSLQLAGTEARDALREELGLNLPLWEQYVNWLQEMARGNLGREFSLFRDGTPVAELLGEAIPSTLLVFVTGAFIAFMLGHWLGKLTAWRVPKWFSGSITFGSIAFYTSFPPWLAFLLGYLFIDKLELSVFERALSRSLWQLAPVSQSEVMTKMIVASVVMWLAVFVGQKVVWRIWRRSIPRLISLLVIFLGMYLFWSVGD
jgi:ABC-type dipeptide/oligopeptide/nickel transport system permease component